MSRRLVSSALLDNSLIKPCCITFESSLNNCDVIQCISPFGMPVQWSSGQLRSSERQAFNLNKLVQTVEMCKSSLIIPSPCGIRCECRHYTLPNNPVWPSDTRSMSGFKDLQFASFEAVQDHGKAV